MNLQDIYNSGNIEIQTVSFNASPGGTKVIEILPFNTKKYIIGISFRFFNALSYSQIVGFKQNGLYFVNKIPIHLFYQTNNISILDSSIPVNAKAKGNPIFMEIDTDSSSCSGRLFLLLSDTPNTETVKRKCSVVTVAGNYSLNKYPIPIDSDVRLIKSFNLIATNSAQIVPLNFSLRDDNTFIIETTDFYDLPLKGEVPLKDLFIKRNILVRNLFIDVLPFIQSRKIYFTYEYDDIRHYDKSIS